MEFRDKIVLITGANRGIGKALVEACLKKEVKKIYACARDKNALSVFQDERIIPLTLDISNQDQRLAAANMALDVQILINNAGVLHPGSLFGESTHDFREDMEINYFATIEMMRAFLPVLMKNKEARMINIASIAKFTNFPFIAGYSASKAALYSISQAARIELAQHNIPVHIVNPGAIDTDMNKGSTMQMTAPHEMAMNLLIDVEAEIEDIIPDKIGKSMYEIWERSPKELEALSRQLFFQN
ncbi:short-chain dehydrogenase [Bacteriovorax stolpii]|uniref:Short-chain dehydrogenase n=1 Tax=Bacteriovorax stolpii TaxID=960 RepID=A0A2K9NP63_BACTC|nr:SDR family oxidoreductase [Bacteriovorax stolpii]AUN97309.1 short-chain dehydrogenase [Bacteriovorax stolpii]TDP52480.1 NAD(P)-dependent dehydrogenase (short-subunit alcohol dehydrogenase family) [Bacteriovorax stolpii]